ncbi:hypothetical protein [Pedobacter panaciterrae]
MKHLLIIALILLSITSCNYAQQPANANSASPGKAISYEDWKKEAKTNIRLIPKFGNAVKSESQKKLINSL